MRRSRPAPASRANRASSAAKNGLETPFDTYQNTSSGDRLHESGHVQPLVAVVAGRGGAPPFGRSDPADDRLQPNAVLIRGPDLNRLVRVLGSRLIDGLLQLLWNGPPLPSRSLRLSWPG